MLAFALLASASPALAVGPSLNASVNAGVEVRGQGNSDDSTDDTDTEDDDGTPDQGRSDNAKVHATGTAAVGANASTTRGENGEAHRSAVATFVQSLLSIADRDGGIGAEVRAVAQSQNESASTTAEAMAKVESRSKAVSFLFGTDWTNLGKLRAELAKGERDIARLETALESTTSASVKADLEAEIVLLKDEQAKVTAFVEAHEDEFSLFGWFTKLFAQVEA